MTEARLRALAGACLVAFLVLATVPYIYLVQTFQYDDILREPTGVILAAFNAGGTSLVLAWFAFALAAFFFTFVALALSRWLEAATGNAHRLATMFGVASGLLQAIGLARWVFVVPPLAAAHADPATSEASRAAIEAVFTAVHQYGGVAIGEDLGQLTLLVWTIGMAAAFLRMPGLWKVLGALPAITVPLWLIAQTELLHSANPSFTAYETAPFAFILWQGWLLALGAALLATAFAGRAAPQQPVMA
ncbi:MAG: DUF4386 domain-containing protein [Rhizobiaceae bacterium]|nr:DUF4386 domain-containing protein [Rhizobiaceae bacterium]